MSSNERCVNLEKTTYDRAWYKTNFFGTKHLIMLQVVFKFVFCNLILIKINYKAPPGNPTKFNHSIRTGPEILMPQTTRSKYALSRKNLASNTLFLWIQNLVRLNDSSLYQLRVIFIKHIKCTSLQFEEIHSKL